MKKSKKKRKKIRRLAFVVFDKSSCTDEQYEQYYKKVFDEKQFIYMGEVPNAPGHCMLYDLTTNEMIGMYHIENFREATSEEV